MIVTHLKVTYPALIREPSKVDDATRLREITTGVWPKLNEATLKGYDDVLVGTFGDMIVSAYRITGSESVMYEGKEKIRFTVAPPLGPDGQDPWLSLAGGPAEQVDPVAWLIGCPIPGGPWKQGETRGTRRYTLKDYLDDYPELRKRDAGDFDPGMARALLAYFRGDRHVATDDFPQLAADHASPLAAGPDTGVTVVRQPGGAVVITIPTGTRARLEIDPD